MTKKILVIGGVAGGASAAARLRRHCEHDEIIIFEKGPHVSFSNCCLPYHLSGIVPNAEKLVLMTPEKFASQYNIDARVNNEVISIDRDNKTIEVKNTQTNKVYTESYDKLILSPGAKPIMPTIKGLDKVNAFSIRNVVDIDKLKRFIDSHNAKNISVIGGGFIGIEVMENLHDAGYKVTLIEAMNQVMKPFDYSMAQILHKEIYDKGVRLILDDKVAFFKENKVILASEKEIDADVVILAIGVKPETDLAIQADLDIGKTGAMKVNQNYQTNDPDIYAVGDVIEVYSYLYNDHYQLPLAGPAQKQARSVADHIHGMTVNNRGFIGSSVVKVFDYNAACTGLSAAEIEMRNLHLEYETVKIIPNDKVALMPFGHVAHFKLIYEVPTGRILGAQSIGKGNIDKRIDVIATVIKFGGTIDDLKDLELCYAPPFGTAKDIVNFAGYVATNLMNSDFKQVHAFNMRKLVESGACIVDVREVAEYQRSHIKCALNVPLSQLRERVSEIPKDQPVYLHCRSGQRSYNAALVLQHYGYKNVFNLSGGFMGLCFFEYFNDKTLGRDPIMTDYNFD